ncbi:hypothetical protein WJX82_002526 [Trebouxia sp. C0006]
MRPTPGLTTPLHQHSLLTTPPTPFAFCPPSHPLPKLQFRSLQPLSPPPFSSPSSFPSATLSNRLHPRFPQPHPPTKPLPPFHPIPPTSLPSSPFPLTPYHPPHQSPTPTFPPPQHCHPIHHPISLFLPNTPASSPASSFLPPH